MPCILSMSIDHLLFWVWSQFILVGWYTVRSKILAGENIGEFGECMVIRQNFPCYYFALYGECVGELKGLHPVLWLPFTSHRIVPPCRKKIQQTMEIFLGTCPTVVAPFLISTAEGWSKLPTSLSQRSILPSLAASQMHWYTWNPPTTVCTVNAWYMFTSCVTISGTVIGKDFELLLLLASRFFGDGRQFITCQLL